ncbi:MAG: hypothetical protein M3Y27_18620, partial [Acidobacteriota bacterium]|nr:hypothetical protein [Acidobacteriota bacterium]
HRPVMKAELKPVEIHHVVPSVNKRLIGLPAEHMPRGMREADQKRKEGKKAEPHHDQPDAANTGHSRDAALV